MCVPPFVLTPFPLHVSCRLHIHHRLNHPLIVKMLDVFICKDSYLDIVLEYVEHGTLFNLINNTPAPSEAVVRWVHAILEAAQVVLEQQVQQV
jgi:serine/threonine protein kinase